MQKLSFPPTQFFKIQMIEHVILFHSIPSPFVQGWVLKHNEAQESKLYKINRSKNGKIAQEHSRTMDEYSFLFTIVLMI